MPTSQLDDDLPLPPEILGITGPANAEQHDNDLNTIAAMQQWGGHFVKQLAELALRADYHNLQRLKAAWPEHWQRYADLHADRGRIADLTNRLARAGGGRDDVVYCSRNHEHYSKDEAMRCEDDHARGR